MTARPADPDLQAQIARIDQMIADNRRRLLEIQRMKVVPLWQGAAIMFTIGICLMGAGAAFGHFVFWR